jgi:hypothetical protein
MEYGTKVIVSTSDYIFEGIIVGQASAGITNTWLVECTDGFIPNLAYPYEVAYVFGHQIFIREDNPDE